MYFQTLKLDFDIFSNVHTIKDKYFNFILILVCTDFERECRIILVFFLVFFLQQFESQEGDPMSTNICGLLFIVCLHGAFIAVILTLMFPCTKSYFYMSSQQT